MSNVLSRHGRSTLSARSIVAACGLAMGCSIVQAQVTIRAVAISGDPAPGMPGITLDRLGEPRLTPGGRIAYWANLAGSGITSANDGSIFTDRTGVFALAVQEGTPEPGGSGDTINAMTMPAFSASGRLAFAATLSTNAEITNWGILAESAPGVLGVFAREAEPYTRSLHPVEFNRAGDASASFGGAAVLTNRDGATQAVVNAGDIAPDAPAGSLFRVFSKPRQDAGGGLVIRATASVDPSDREPEIGLWRSDDPESQQLIAITGAHAPGTPPATTFAFVGLASAPDSSGRIAFRARVQGPGIDETNDAGLWAGGPGSVMLVMREGDIAPPPADDNTWGSLLGAPAMGASGRVAFVASINGLAITEANNTQLWAIDAGGLAALIAGEDDDAGFGDGSRFGSFTPPAVNPAGQVAFLAGLRDADPGANQALLATTRAGTLQPVVRIGDVLDVRGDGSDLRTVRDINFGSGGSESGFEQFNALGTIVLILRFTDFSHGVFEAQVGCPADFNGDGQTNLFDFLAFQTAFGGESPAADLNGDGALNLFDFLAFQTIFGNGC